MSSFMYKTSLISLVTAVVLGTVGCSSGSDSGSDGGTSGVLKAYSGIGIDGILVGSTVCIDVNQNNACDVGEPTDPDGTDAQGKFEIPETTKTGPLLLIGGVDNSTGEAFTGSLKAPAGSTVVTPLTSAVQSLVESGKSAEDAEANVKAAMGLTDVNLTTFDPYAEIDGVNALKAQEVLAKQTQLQVLVHSATVTVAGADTGTDVNSTMSSVFDAIVENFDGATGEVTLDEETVAAATKSAADEVYADNAKARVAAKVVAQTSAENSVRDADSAEEAISSGTPAEATGNLDAAISKVNTTAEDELRAAAEAAKVAADALNAAKIAEIEALQKAQQEKEAEIAAAKAAQVQAEADLAAAKAAAEADAQDRAKYEAFLAAQAEAEKAAKEKALADLAVAQAQAAAAEQEALIAAQAAQRQAAAEAAATQAQAEADAAQARQDAADVAAADAAAAADLAAAQQAAADAQAAAALGIAQAEVNANVQIANFFASQAQAAATATQALADLTITGSLADANASAAASAATAAAQAASDANITIPVDNNISEAVAYKDVAAVQAAIAAAALSGAQDIKAAAELAAAAQVAQDAKAARIQIIVTSVIALDANVTAELNASNAIGDKLEEDKRAIFAILAEYPAVQAVADEANATKTEANDLHDLAENSAQTVVDAKAAVLAAQVAGDETAAQNAQADAQAAIISFTTSLNAVHTKATEVGALLIQAEGIRDGLNAEEAARIAAAILASQNSVTASVSVVNTRASDANASATQALADATAAGVVASNNPNAGTYAQAAQAAADAAGQAAGEAAAQIAVAMQADTNATADGVTEAQAAAAQVAATTAATNAATAATTAATQAGIANAQLVLAQNATTPPSGGFSEGMSLNWIDEDDDGIRVGKVTLASGGLFTEVREILDVDSATFVPDTNSDEDLVLQADGSWATENSETYTLLNGVASISSGEEVKIATTIPLDTPIGPVAAVIAEINEMIPGDENLTFSMGAKAYQLAFKESESYKLWYMPIDCSEWGNNSCIGTQTPYSTLEEYMASYNSPAGMQNEFGEWIGVDFQRDTDANASQYYENPVIDATGAEVTTLTDGQTGNLVIFDTASPSGDQDIVGTWEVVTLPNGQIAIMIAPTTGNEKYFDDNLIAVANSVVYKGEHTPATTTFVTEEDEVEFNDIAINDIKAAIIRYIESAPDTATLTALLAGKTGWTTIYEQAGTLESWVYAQDMQTASWNEVSGGSCSGTGSISIDGDTITFTPISDSCEQTLDTTPVTVVFSQGGVNYALISVNSSPTQKFYFDETAARADFLGETPNTGNNSGYELDVEKLTLTNTAWTWQELMDVNGTLVDDPSEEADEENISIANNIMSLNGGTASIKYLGQVTPEDFNTQTGASFAQGTIHKLAYIRNNEEMDSWGEEVQNWTEGEGATFANLEAMISTYDGSSGHIYSNDGFSDGGLAFDGAGKLIIVDANGGVVNANAGTYSIVSGTDDDGTYRAIKTLPTYSGYSRTWHDAYIERAGKVYYGDWSAVDSGGIFYLFDETSKDEFVTWFYENKTILTDEIEFGEEKANFRTEYNAITLFDTPSNLIAVGTLYELSTDSVYNSEPAPVIDFTGLVGKTIYFQTDSEYYGVRTFNGDNTTTGLLSWAGEYAGTYTTYDNVVDINNSGTITRISFDEQPDFDDLMGIVVSVNGNPNSTWNSTYSMPASLMNKDVTYTSSGGATGIRHYGENALVYDENGSVSGGYIYNPQTGIVQIRDGMTTTSITLPLSGDINDMVDMEITKVRDSDNYLLFSGTTTYTIGGASVSFDAATYFDATKYFVNENGITGYRTYDATNGSYVGLVNGSTAAGGFVPNVSNPAEMQIIRTSPSQLIMVFTHDSSNSSGNMEVFDLDIQGSSSIIKTYMFDSELERDSFAQQMM